MQTTPKQISFTHRRVNPLLKRKAITSPRGNYVYCSQSQRGMPLIQNNTRSLFCYLHPLATTPFFFVFLSMEQRSSDDETVSSQL